MGNLVGSLVSYGIAYWGSKKALRLLIRWRLLNKNDLSLSVNVFRNYGKMTAFFSRLLPIVRTFISFPAGLFKSNIISFSILTFTGSFIWSAVLTYLGVVTGDNWQSLRGYFHKFDFVIAILIVVGIFMVFKHHFSGDRIEDDEDFNF